jgi:hypothetical protein
MIGDLGPISVRQQFPSFPSVPGVPPPSPPHVPPTTPSPAKASSLIPSVRGLKISENQSPLPQDRVYFTFDYFDNLNKKLNRDFESPLGNLQAYRYIFGFEKTFDGGWGSIGLRFPIDTISAKSVIPVKFNTLAGTFTSVNDLSIIGKYVIRSNVDTGSIISTGLVVTPPTGPRQFAGAPFLNSPHTITFQPYLGYIWNFSRRWTLHGFSAFDFPADPNLVTIMYNDVGLIYYAYRSADPDRFLQTIAPTFEVHVNTPFNHRDAFNPNDPSGTPDFVNLTYGINFQFRQRSVLTFGIVTPVTGPRPFDLEALALLNIFFGRSRNVARGALPMIGG